MRLYLLAPAFVLKNFVKTRNKIILFHKNLGKITCVYSSKDGARNLCAGSLIFCTVEKKKSYYIFIQIQVDFVPLNCSLSTLSFIHDILRLCLFLLPNNIAVHELFDFLLYVYQRLSTLKEQGKYIVLLRMFLLFDLLPNQHKMYQYALQDPCGNIDQSSNELKESLRLCWSRFDQEIYRQKDKM